MQYDLVALSRRTRNIQRKAITLRDIAPPAVLATNLYVSVYKPVVALWTRTAERVIAEYERSLSAITTDAPVDLQALLDEADNDFQRLVILLNAALDQWGISVERWQRGKFRGAVLSATSVDLSTMLGPEDVAQTLEQVLAWNVSLVRDVSTQARQKIANAVFAGLTARSPAADVAKEIRAATGFARDRSQRIAAHQLASLSSQLAAERRRQAGLSAWQWRHGMKKHPREWHKARNGNLYSDDPDMVGKVIEGQTVLSPPEGNDLPGIPPYCSCRQLSVLVFSDD